MPFSAITPNAVEKNKCGVCEEVGALTKYIECKSLDSGFATLYICKKCMAIYNSTAEVQTLDVLEWQKRWAEDPEFYKVPKGGEFDEIIGNYNQVFKFFENDLDVKFGGTYLEIGAGSGVMAAAALNFFEDVYAFDHVRERLAMTQEQVGAEHYHIVTDETIKDVRADLILIWHALEHFLSPGGVFKLCASCLKKGGYVVIQVPVLSLEHVYPGHYYFYNEIALTEMAKLAGLRAIKFYYDHSMNAMTAAFTTP